MAALIRHGRIEKPPSPEAGAAEAGAVLRLEPADAPESLAERLGGVARVEVNFPSFTDGRGYSIGRLLRERYRYAGELRAVGDVGRDQLYYLAQCGFDAFLIPDGRDGDDSLRAFADFTDGYQATVARTPWFRRRHATEDPRHHRGARSGVDAAARASVAKRQ